MPVIVFGLCVIGFVVIRLGIHVFTQLREETLYHAELFRRLKTYDQKRVCNMTISISKQDLQVIDDALDILRKTFAQTNDVKTAQTILQLVRTRDHIYALLVHNSIGNIPGES